MRRLTLFLALLLCLMAHPALADEAILLFEEDFEGGSVTATLFSRCPETTRHGASCWDDDHSYINSKGELVLEAVYDEEDGLVHCGAVRTRDEWQGGYGYYEASIKLPHTPGVWGAFWIMAGQVSSEENGARDGIEIDVIESIRGHKGVCCSALHWDAYGDRQKDWGRYMSAQYLGIDVYDGNFHTFGVLRDERGYKFYIDDQLTWTVTAQTAEPCPELGYMKLSVEAGAWAGFGSRESIESLPTAMYVDYVRVWDRKP